MSKMMHLEIRPARASDAAALAELLRSIGLFRDMAAETAEETAAGVLRRLGQCLADDNHTIYVAEAPGGVVGYGSVHWLPYLFIEGPEGFVSELFVRESERGRGVGRALLDALVREARERGCSRLQLINFRTRDSYQRGFYAKAGWEERPDAANFVYHLERA